MLFAYIYAYWCPTRFLEQMIFLSFNSNTTGVTSGTGTPHLSGAPLFQWNLCCSIFSFVCSVRWIFVSPFPFDHCIFSLTSNYPFDISYSRSKSTILDSNTLFWLLMPIRDSSNTKLHVLALIKLDIDIPHQIQQQCYKCIIITLYIIIIMECILCIFVSFVLPPVIPDNYI
jgi:hypothetical protein